jgi:AAA domain
LPVRVADPAVCQPSGHHAACGGFGCGSKPLHGYRATGHLLSAPQGLQHFLAAAQAAAAEIIILDPLYSTHDQDENDTRAMAALCQSLLRLREASRAALIVVHHVRKSIGRYEIGSAFRGSSALHAVGDSYLLLTRPSPQFNTVELRFQFRYAAPQPPRLLQLDPSALWFSAAGVPPAAVGADRHKVEPADVRQALADLGAQARYNQLRQQIMTLSVQSTERYLGCTQRIASAVNDRIGIEPKA